MVLNRVLTSANLCKIFFYEMPYGRPAPLNIFPFLTPGTYEILRRTKIKQKQKARYASTSRAAATTLAIRTRHFYRMENASTRCLSAGIIKTCCFYGNNRKVKLCYHSSRHYRHTFFLLAQCDTSRDGDNTRLDE